MSESGFPVQKVWHAGMRKKRFSEFAEVVRAASFHYARVVMGPQWRMGGVA